MAYIPQVLQREKDDFLLNSLRKCDVYEMKF